MSSSDVIVIGGGLVGTAVAYGLGQLGKNITVLDEGDDVFRASRGNFGLIWVHGKGRGVPDYARWTRESARLWPALAAQLHGETGIDVQARQTGAFNLCFSEAELAARSERLAAVRDEVGGEYPYEILDRAALLQRPALGGCRLAGGRCVALSLHARVGCATCSLLHDGRLFRMSAGNRWRGQSPGVPRDSATGHEDPLAGRRPPCSLTR